jgi:LysM repeat protein
MKLLKIFGIVAGIHAIALLLIFANPGCSSTTRTAAVAPPSPPPAPKPDPAPAIIAAPAISPAAIVAAPPDPAPEASPAAGSAYYSPTRPGTPAANALEAQPVADVTPATPYTVGKGDSLWSIAKKNHIRVSALAAANHLRVGSTLRPGQKLIVPGQPPAGRAAAAPPAADPKNSPGLNAGPAAAEAGGERQKHVVRSGETLGSIARRYGIRLGDLATANNISDPQKIRPGQELIIPPGGRAAGGKNAAKSRAAAAPPPAAAAPVPGANQDLDSGLKPAAPSSQPPVIRIDPDAGAASAPKQP